MARLGELGLAKNTYVIFSSDNGPVDPSDLSANGIAGIGSPGPFRGFKGSLYEGGIRTPFIIRGPGVSAGRIDEKTVLSGVDLLPTISSLAEVALPLSYRSDGENMSQALLGRATGRSKPLFWFYPVRYRAATIHQSPVLAVKRGSWKLLVNTDGSRMELYETAKDLTETNNRATDHPKLARELRRIVMKWHAQLPSNSLEPGAGTLTFASLYCNVSEGWRNGRRLTLL